MTTDVPDWVAEHEARKNWVNQLFYGDNLDVLRDRIASESVDLVYLDPPFNSNRSYNVLFGAQHGDHASAQRDSTSCGSYWGGISPVASLIRHGV